MMSIQEYKLVNANEKSSVNNIQNCHKELTKLKTQVKPNENQCIAMDGYIIFEGNYHPDAIVTYKTPRKTPRKKVDYEFDKFPKEYQEEVQKLQMKLNLTKKQIKELRKTVKSFNMQINDIEKTLDLLRIKASEIKNKDKKKKQINNFFKSFEKFSKCLTSDLASYDLETKNEIRKELTKLIHLIEDVIEKYLS